MKTRHSQQPHAKPVQRQDRRIQERVHDPYKPLGKIPEPTVCPECHAVIRGGRWQWLSESPPGAHEQLCQACARIRDHCPAGELHVSGSFVRDHKEEILQLIRHEEDHEKSQHPLHRIMDVEETPGEIMVRTTDLHLPHRLGQALHRAHKGTLSTNYSDEECYVRVQWNRDEEQS